MAIRDLVQIEVEDRAFDGLIDDMTRNGTPYKDAYRAAYSIAYRWHYRKARRPLGVMLALATNIGALCQ